MRVRSVTEWTTAAGKRRRIRLFNAWQNLRGRCSGRLRSGSGAKPWQGLEIGFRDWSHFREWALQAGYCKALCSLDRIDPSKGYTPENCRWLSVADNTRWRFYTHRDYPDVPF